MSNIQTAVMFVLERDRPSSIEEVVKKLDQHCEQHYFWQALSLKGKYCAVANAINDLRSEGAIQIEPKNTRKNTHMVPRLKEFANR